MITYLAKMKETGNTGNITPIDEVTERGCDIYGKYGLQLGLYPEVGFDVDTSRKFLSFL